MLGSSIKIKIGLLHNSFSTFIRKSSNKAVEQTLNIDIKPFINNRNPRNLERLNIARKPTGYHLDKAGREFWHKLQISRKNRYVAGSVIHYTGNVVVSASSSEFGIGRHLYRAYDTSSFINVALVLAHRCFESGIYCMIIDEELKNAGVKVSAFLKKIQEEGIILSEPRQYKPLTPWSLEVMQKPWKVHV